MVHLVLESELLEVSSWRNGICFGV